MTPEFSPRPTGLPEVPVSISAVGPDMLRMAGRVCDGVRLHGFCTRKYVEEVCLPRLQEGLERSGRKRADFEVWGGGFIATGPDAAAVQKALEEIRYRVAFYGSTRTYGRVFELHDLQDLAAKLHRMSVEGKWADMAREVPDDVLELFVAAGPYDQLNGEIEKRFGGLTDVLTLAFSARTPTGLQREITQDLKRVPSGAELTAG
jgi:probable F420-dependent oxidoreductase